MKVVDASVAVKWFAEEANTDVAMRLLKEDLIAPSVILGEVANGLFKKWRLGQVTREQSLAAIANLPDMLADLTGAQLLVDRAAQIAFEVDHPVHDCFYVALAERHQLPVVTADFKMVDRFMTTPYASLVEALT